jgi:hypothetical protein
MDPFELFFSMTRSYVTRGWPFLVLHLGVLYLVWRDLREFRRWVFDPAQPDMWQEYESRSQRLRGQVGLFLVIGIAGSFFGLFELATWDGDVSKFRAALTSALQRAFPVGFYGILLYMLGNFLADRAEDAKVPLGARRSKGQAAIVGVLESIDRKLGGIPETLAQVLGPISSLQGTLQEALEPTVREIGAVLREQGAQLGHSRVALEGAARRLAESAAELSAAVREVKGVSAKVATMGKAATASAEAAQALLSSTESRLTLHFEAVASALGRTDAVMMNIEAHAAAAFDAMASRAAERLSQTGSEAAATLDAITSTTEAALGRQDELLASSEKHLLAGMEQQRGLLDSSTNAVADGAARASQELKLSLDQLLREHKEAMNQSTDALARVGASTKLAMDELSRAHREGAQRLADDAERLNRAIGGTYEGLQRTLEAALLRAGESFGVQVSASARSALEPVQGYVREVEAASEQAARSSEASRASLERAARQVAAAADGAEARMAPALGGVVAVATEARDALGDSVQQIEQLARGLRALGELEKSSSAAAASASALKTALDTLRPSLRPPQVAGGPVAVPRKRLSVLGRLRAFLSGSNGRRA